MTKRQINLKKEEKKKITVELPKKWADHLEHLEKTTSKKKDYYVCEALYRHLEDIEDYEIAVKSLKSNSKTYRGKEVDKRLEELRAKNV